MTASNLAIALIDCERFSEAEPILLHVYTRRSQLLGDAHPETLTVMRNLADPEQLGPGIAIAIVRECLAAGPCRFHVLVPASPPHEALKCWPPISFW